MLISSTARLSPGGDFRGELQLRDTTSWRLKTTLHGHSDEIMTVAVSPDRKTMASGSADRTIRLWDAETGEERAVLRGHGDWVYSLAFPPDGQTLASCSKDGTIKLWSAPSLTEPSPTSGAPPVGVRPGQADVARDLSAHRRGPAGARDIPATERQRLKYIKKVSNLSLVIPTLDSEISAFISLESELKEMGIRLFLPTKEQYEMRSKIRLAEVCEKAGLDFPRTKIISDAEVLYQLYKEIPFPYVLKGIFYGASVVNSMDEALTAFYKTTAQWGLPVIAQEFLEGEEYDIVAVGDGLGHLAGSLPMKKTSLTDKGKGWAGVIVKDPKDSRSSLCVCRQRSPEAALSADER